MLDFYLEKFIEKQYVFFTAQITCKNQNDYYFKMEKYRIFEVHLYYVLVVLLTSTYLYKYLLLFFIS